VSINTFRDRPIPPHPEGWGLLGQRVEGKGEGRRFRIYALKATIDEIIGYYEAEKNMESIRAMESIQRLKEMITT
jgi:predicted transcriptional regulator